jgi:hypothetical protein
MANEEMNLNEEAMIVPSIVTNEQAAEPELDEIIKNHKSIDDNEEEATEEPMPPTGVEIK